MAKKKRPSRPRPAVTEDDLLKDFDAHRKAIGDLGEPCAMPEFNEGRPAEPQEPTYVLEPLFFYRVHASV
jgi:hypothetical protein